MADFFFFFFFGYNSQNDLTFSLLYCSFLYFRLYVSICAIFILAGFPNMPTNPSHPQVS